MKKKKYIVNGQVYEIPDDESAAFLKDFPTAKIQYDLQGKIYEIPHQESDAFETDMGLKKKVSSNAVPVPSGSGLSGGEVDGEIPVVNGDWRKANKYATGDYEIPNTNIASSTSTNLSRKNEISETHRTALTPQEFAKENEDVRKQALATTAKRSKRTEAEVQKDIDEGKLVLSTDSEKNKIYARQPGAWESFVKSLTLWKRSLQDAAGVAALKATGTDEDLANFNEIVNSRKKVESEKEFGLSDAVGGLPVGSYISDSFKQTNGLPTAEPGVAGQFTGFVGGVGPDVALAAATGGMGNTAKGAILGGKMLASEYGNKEPELYEKAKQIAIQRGATEEDAKKWAAQEASIDAVFASIPQATLNTAFFMEGLHSPASKNFLTVLGNTVKDVSKVSALGGGSSALTSGIEGAEGYDTKGWVEKMVGQFGDFAKLELLFKVIPIIKTLPKATQSAVKEFAVDPVIKPLVEQYIKTLSEQTQRDITQQLADYEAATKDVRGIVPEEKMASIGGRIEKRKNRINGINIIKRDITELEAKKTNLPEALHKEVDAAIAEKKGQIGELEKEIDSVDKEIESINKSKGTGLEKEVDEATGEPIIPKEQPVSPLSGSALKDVEKVYNEKKQAIEDKLNQQLEDNKDMLDDIDEKGGTKTVRQKIYQEHTNEMVELEKWKMKEDLKNEDTPDGRIKKNNEFSANQLTDAIPNSEVHYENKEDYGVTTITLRDKNSKKHIASIDIGTGDTIDGYAGVRIQVNGEHQGKGLSKHLYNLALTEAKKQGLKGLYTIDEMLKTPDKTISTRDNFVTRKNTDEKLKSQARKKYTNIADPSITFIENVSDKFIKKGATELAPTQYTEAAGGSALKDGFKEAGEKARDTKDATHIGRWMLDNSQKGDVIRFQDGGYEVTEVNTKKDGTKELVLTPFEFNEDGSKDYNNTGIKIITEQSIKNGSNLFENTYTNSKGERVIEQSTYESKAPTQYTEAATPKPEIKNEETKISDTEKETGVTDEAVNQPVRETTQTTGEGGGGKKPPVGEDGNVDAGKEELHGITLEANRQRREAIGMNERVVEKESFEQWDKEAESQLAKGYDINKLIEKMNKGEATTPVENSIRKIYAATLDKAVELNPSDELLAQAKKYAEAEAKANAAAGRDLVSLKGNGTPRDSLKDFYVAKMEAVGADTLTEAQKAEVKKKFEEVQKERDDYKKKYEDATAKFTEMQAKSELSKPSSKGKTTTGKRDYKAERQSLKDRLKQEIEEYKAAGQKMGIASDGGGESFVISAKIAKTIAEIAKTHVAEVGVKIKEVVERTLEDVKEYFGEGISDKDIMNVLAGKYNEKKQTKNELAAQMRELNTEAKLLERYESLLKKEPQSERKKVEKNQRLKELRDEIKELQKEQGVGQYSEIEKAKRAIERNKAREQKIREKIANKDYEPAPKPQKFWESPEFKKNHPKLYNEVLDSQVRMEEAQLEFERNLIADEMSRAGLVEKGKEVWRKTAGTVKHLFASFDFSGLGVQNLPMILTNPVIGAKGIKMSFADFASQKRFDRYLTELHNSADWKLMKDSGLRVSEPKSLLEEGREQLFPDRFKAIVKIKGKTYGYMKIGEGKYELLDISKPFERQFVSLGNSLRVIKFRTEAEKLLEKGYTFEKNPQEFEGLAKRINNLTSGADVPRAFQGELTNTFIWSTRLIAAKLNMLGISDLVALTPVGRKLGVEKGYYQSLGVKGQKISRQQLYAAADLAKFTASVMATTYLAAMAGGGTVNTDPTDDAFLDVKFKDGISKNYTGGFSKYIALVTQLIRQGKSKNGQFVPYSGIKDRGQQVTHFLAGKAPPITRAVESILIGKDYTGKETDLGAEANKLKYPMAAGQITEQIKKDGLEGLFEQGIETLIGINVKDERDYQSKDSKTPIQKKKAEMKKKKKEIRRSMGLKD